MDIEPDFDGFATAQATLREKFGRDLRFYTPEETTYPEGTPLDPESGRPYDPTILPTASGYVATDVRVSVVNRPVQGTNDTMKRKAIGWLESGGIVLIVDPADWASIETATEVEYADERYVIRQSDHDYFGPVDRYLLYCEQM